MRLVRCLFALALLLLAGMELVFDKEPWVGTRIIAGMVVGFAPFLLMVYLDDLPNGGRR